MSSCLLCGSDRVVPLFKTSDWLYQTTQRQFAVVSCGRCGLMRLDPQPPPEELGRYYPNDYWFEPDKSAPSRMEEAYRRLVLRDHIGFVGRALRGSCATGPLLDVGCGGGLLPGIMRKRGFRAVGLDISQTAAAMVWRRHQTPAICARLENAPFRAGSLRAVTMFHVLEHLHDPRSYLISARNLLARDGRLILQVPNAASWQFRLLGPRWNGMDVPRHLFHFRKRDIESLIESCGFEVVHRKHFSLRDNPAGLATSVVPWLDPMARRSRRAREGRTARVIKDLMYLLLVIAALPFTLAEAAFGAGATIMVEARPR